MIIPSFCWVVGFEHLCSECTNFLNICLCLSLCSPAWSTAWLPALSWASSTCWLFLCTWWDIASHNNALVRPGHRGAETWHGLWSALVLLVLPTCPGAEEEGISSLFKRCSSVKQLGALLVAVELILSPGKPLTLLQNYFSLIIEVGW